LPDHVREVGGVVLRAPQLLKRLGEKRFHRVPTIGAAWVRSCPNLVSSLLAGEVSPATPLRSPRKRRAPLAQNLSADAKQEQQDDERKRRAEQPQQNEDHLVTSFLDPRGAVVSDRSRGTARLVVAEVHRFA
jgi:hypothetical protein